MFIDHTHTHSRTPLSVMSLSQRTVPPQHTINTIDSTAMTSAGYEPVVPAMEQPPTYTSDHMTTRIGKYVFFE